MDIYCTNCGEPWEIGEFEAQLAKRGRCPACEGKPRPANRRSEVASALAGVLGDDIDGIGAMLEDAEYMGLL